jgi:predicted histone-like DNA-binding protein
MAVQYVLNQRVNPRDITAPKKYYAQAKSKNEQTTRQLATEISKRSGLSVPDVMAVIESFIDLIPEKIADGNIVRIGEFGSFNLSISSEGTERPEDFTASMIRSNSMNFRPGKIVQQVLNNVEYKKASE